MRRRFLAARTRLPPPRPRTGGVQGADRAHPARRPAPTCRLRRCAGSPGAELPPRVLAPRSGELRRGPRSQHGGRVEPHGRAARADRPSRFGRGGHHRRVVGDDMRPRRRTPEADRGASETPVICAPDDGLRAAPDAARPCSSTPPQPSHCSGDRRRQAHGRKGERRRAIESS